GAITLRLNPRSSVESIGARQQSAGLGQRITPKSFLSIKGAGLVAGLVIGLILTACGSAPLGLVLTVVLAAVGFMGPEVLLSSRIRSRRDAVRGDLPDALDLLVISVEAGLGFDGAITKLTEHMDGPLVQEFAMMLSEIRIGEARQTALKNMAARVDAPELSSF